MTALDLQTEPWVLWTLVLLTWGALAIQHQRRRVRRHRAARAALSRVLAQRGENAGPDDGELEQQAERGEHHGDGDGEHQDKLNVLKGWHGASVAGPGRG